MLGFVLAQKFAVGAFQFGIAEKLHFVALQLFGGARHRTGQRGIGTGIAAADVTQLVERVFPIAVMLGAAAALAVFQSENHIVLVVVGGHGHKSDSV